MACPSKHGQRLKLQEQPIRLLIVLLENAGEVVSREQIQKALWADVHVDYENAINSAIRKLREVLIDTADNPRYVETLAKRGYRFIAPVSRVGLPRVTGLTPAETPDLQEDRGPALVEAEARTTGAAEVPPLNATGPGARKMLWPLLAVALTAVLAISTAMFWRSAPASESPLQAVPLTSFPGNADTATFSPDGSQVAFAWDGEKEQDLAAIINADIYVQLVGSGSRPLRLTNNPMTDRRPTWSPDGRSIAFTRVESDVKREGSTVARAPAMAPSRAQTALLVSRWEASNVKWRNSALDLITGLGWRSSGDWTKMG
jgi:DNA-binding winged helix-turn-helix (wHTH) protein